MLLNIIHLPKRVDRLELLKKELLVQKIEKHKIWDGIINPIIPVQGISQAHKQIVRYAQREKLPEILIGEDDLHFTEKGAFRFFINNKPNDYDIYLGGILDGKIKKDSTVDDFSGLTLYFINERFYNIFLSMPENTNLDRALRNKGKFLVCNPFVVVQHNGFSDNVKQFCNYDEFLKDRNLFRH